MTNSGGRRGRWRRLFVPVILLAFVGVLGWFTWSWMTGEAQPLQRRETEGPKVSDPLPQPTEVPLTAMRPSQESATAIIGDPAVSTLSSTSSPPATPMPSPEPAAPAAQGTTGTNGTMTTGSANKVIGEDPQPTDSAPSASTATASLESALTLADSDPVAARRALTRLLEGSSLGTADRLRGYEGINRINAVLVFSNRVLPNDPYTVQYKVEEGDSLARIARSQKLDCDWRFIQRINGIANPNALRVGQALKLPKGAFHGEVRKGEYRLNIFMGDGAERVMVASYPIGLGELNSTPTGAFVVRPKSKLIDPEWRNPRTGEFFQSNDPKNPIGERWIGLMGIEPHNRSFEGYGIHGTIELDSIGQQKSMGCVRMLPGDVELVYEVITEPNSTVIIAP
ncbi:MAG: LysM peptidoglycan-binding domain-containing protein [Phycisphaerales bacterium]